MTSSWLTWIQLEQYSALHNLPFASEADGFDGLDAGAGDQQQGACEAHARGCSRWRRTARSNTPAATTQPDPLLVSGQAGIHFDSSGMRGDLVKSAKFDWGEAFLPYDPEIIKSPLNSIIGGASLWTMTAPGRTPAEYKAVAHVPEVHRQAGPGCELASAHRLRAGDARRLRAVEAAGLLRRRTPAPTCRSSS